MNKRVFLLNPPSWSEVSSFPLGLACLSSTLRQKGFEVIALDAAAPYASKSSEEVINMIKDFKPLFIGMHMMFDFVYEKYRLAREIKELGYPLVGGGPHANLVPEEVLNNGFDIVSIGEGDEVILQLAEAFNKGEDLEKIDGLGLRRSDGTVVFTKRRELIKDLDTIPFADYRDFPIKNYTGKRDYSSNKTYFNIFSSRGCPHRCTFCSSSRVWGSRYRWRSAKNVFDEIVHLKEGHGAKYFAFQDNEPLVNRRRMFELCDFLKESKINVKISTRARVDNLDEDLLKKMMDVGFYKLAIGVESGDEETLKRVNRNYTRADIQRTMEMLERIRFPVIHFNNLIGFPWETEKHLKNTLDMNLKIPKNLTYYVNVVTPIPLPATPLYEEYCDKYNFRDWWFDSKIQKAIEGTEVKKTERPLFRIFMPRLKIEYLNTDFWKYSTSMKNSIMKLQLKLQQLAYKKNRNISRVDIFIAFLLIRLSIRLFMMSPRLEKKLMFPLRNRYVFALARKLIFKEQ
jgi:radical SAM superfamily enzyme YgiQ (UPF0313 family)